MSFSWNSVISATHYFLEIGTAAGLLNVANLNTERPTTSWAHSLWPGVYFWRVRAVVGGVVGDPSVEQVLLVPAGN